MYVCQVNPSVTELIMYVCVSGEPVCDGADYDIRLTTQLSLWLWRSEGITVVICVSQLSKSLAAGLDLDEV